MYMCEAAAVVSNHLKTETGEALEFAINKLWRAPKHTRKLERALTVLANNQRTLEMVREHRTRESIAATQKALRW